MAGRHTMDGKHGRTTLGVTCHHRLWTADTVERRQVGHAIIAFGPHTVERRQAWHDITAFGQHTRSNDVGRDISSPPLDSAHSRKTSRVACNHHLWAAHTVEQRRAWHASIAFGKHTRSKDVERGMPSPPLDSTHGQMTLGMASHHHLWTS